MTGPFRVWDTVGAGAGAGASAAKRKEAATSAWHKPKVQVSGSYGSMQRRP